MTVGITDESRLWIERIEGYIGDPDGMFSAKDLQKPELFLQHVAEAYDLRRPRKDTEVGRVAMAEINATIEVMK